MDVKLFLNDTEERIFDTLLLKIKYVEWHFFYILYLTEKHVYK